MKFPLLLKINGLGELMYVQRNRVPSVRPGMEKACSLLSLVWVFGMVKVWKPLVEDYIHWDELAAE